MSRLQDLIARLRLDNSQFGRGLRDSKGQAQGFASAVRSIMAPVAGALASGLSFTAIAAGARLGAAEIDEAAKSARALGGSVGGVRAVELAMSEAGVQAGVMREQFQNMDRQIASGRAETALRALGLQADELSRMDVDEKVATIADRIKDLGLDTGSTLSILQQFGVENRNVSLLMMQGGDAIRAARQDIDEYGLAISQVDASRIEAANDAIGRLALVGQYLRQEMALQLTPALGEFARMLTESLREGGTLRSVIDGLVSVVPRLATYIGVAAGGALAYKAVLTGVAAAKWLVVGATNGLRLALMRLGLPILILAAGEMVYQFGQLVQATGGWGQALDALGQVASATWEGIKLSGTAIEPALAAVWKDIQAGFFTMLESMSSGFASFMGNFTALSALPDWGVTGPFKALGDAAVATTSLVEGFTNSARTAAGQADQLRSQASQLADAGFGRAREALGRLMDMMADGKQTNAEYAGTVRDIYNTLGDVGNPGGGADRAKNALSNVKPELDKIKSGANQVESSLESAFVNGVTNIRNARQALSGLLMDFAKMAAQSAFRSLFGGSSLFSGISNFFGIGANANGTDNWRGGLTWVGERGPELVSLPKGTQINEAQKSINMMRRAGGGMSAVRIELGEGLIGSILSQAEGQTVQIVRAYDSNLPMRQKEIAGDPRRR